MGPQVVFLIDVLVRKQQRKIGMTWHYLQNVIYKFGTLEKDKEASFTQSW